MRCLNAGAETDGQNARSRVAVWLASFVCADRCDAGRKQMTNTFITRTEVNTHCAQPHPPRRGAHPLPLPMLRPPPAPAPLCDWPAGFAASRARDMPWSRATGSSSCLRQRSGASAG